MSVTFIEQRSVVEDCERDEASGSWGDGMMLVVVARSAHRQLADAGPIVLLWRPLERRSPPARAGRRPD